MAGFFMPAIYRQAAGRAAATLSSAPRAASRGLPSEVRPCMPGATWPPVWAKKSPHRAG